MEQLLSLAANCGMRLQCLVSSGEDITAAAVAAVARSHLDAWKKLEPRMLYSMGDNPTLYESFLCR
jgi:hypothetical protein